MTKKQKLDECKYRIDVKDDDVNKSREIISVIIYFAGYCCYAVFKKIKSNNCKSLISGSDNVGEIPEIVIRGLSEILLVSQLHNCKFCNILIM